MNKLKSIVLSFVKPLVLAHVNDMDQLEPMLADIIVKKTNLTPDQATALAVNLVDVVKHEVVILVNKL